MPPLRMLIQLVLILQYKKQFFFEISWIKNRFFTLKKFFWNKCDIFVQNLFKKKKKSKEVDFIMII